MYFLDRNPKEKEDKTTSPASTLETTDKIKINEFTEKNEPYTSSYYPDTKSSNCYENDDVGLGIAFDDDWKVVTVEDYGNIMEAQNLKTYSRVSIDLMDDENMSASVYFDDLYDGLNDYYSGTGLSISDYEQLNFTVDGRVYDAVYYNLTGGESVGCNMIFWVEEGYNDYLVSITGTEDDFQDIISLFYKL